jgi:hypothetical protein
MSRRNREDRSMNRNQLVRQLAVSATRPIGTAMHQPVSDNTETNAIESASRPFTELFVWFEDTASRLVEGRRGVAGLPESLVPCSRSMRVMERRYAENHLHLLSAVRIACKEGAGELIASLYTAALSVGPWPDRPVLNTRVRGTTCTSRRRASRCGDTSKRGRHGACSFRVQAARWPAFSRFGTRQFRYAGACASPMRSG